MKFSSIKIKPDVSNLPDLRHPFWIASSHLTQTESAIDRWAEYEPAALTLKTSMKTPTREGKDSVRHLLKSCAPMYGESICCDGPKDKV